MTKIMLVEDDNNLREIYEARLAAEGYEIVAAPNGEAALAMASKEHPDMIISDVMMPKISGFEMLDILRNTENLRNVKIIMLTALGQAEDSARANSLGADRYLVKSQVTLEDIVKATHELLDPPEPNYEMAGLTPPVDAAVESAPAAPVAAAPPASASPAVEPTVAPVAPVSVEPAPAPASATTPVPAPAVTPVEPAPAVAVAPEPAPAQPAPVVSIPVTDASTDSSAPVAPPADLAAPAMVVVEPSADTASAENVVPTPAGDTITTDTAAPSDNDIASDAGLPDLSAEAAAPTVPGNEIQASDASQTAADEEASVQEQINSFINQSASPESGGPAEAAITMPEPEVPAPPAAETDQAAPVVDMPAAPQAPETESTPEATGNISVAPVNATTSSVAPDDLQAEELNAFSAPVISTPENVTIPEPTDVAIPTVNMPEADAIAAEDDQLVEAAVDSLAQGTQPETPPAPAEPVAPQAPTDNPSGRLKTLAPLGGSTQPDINKLLELEEAKAAAQQAVQATQPPRPNVGAYNPSAVPPQTPNNDSIDPNSISL
jgi:CheY-like chemotaxis protein